MSKSDWHIGQKVAVITRVRQEFTVAEETVTRIGRKYVTVGEGWREQKFDFDGRSDQTWGHQPSLWTSVDAFHAEQDRRKAWTALSSLTKDHYPPDHLSREMIDHIAALLSSHPAPPSEVGP